ncbi:MAG: glycosyltransferase [Candidatus Neomarinimicrobiota bacterium]
MKTLIISPTYNESKNISSLIEHIISLEENYHLLIIDDNSPDGTAEIVKTYQARYSNIFLEVRQKKAGLGTAYLHGFKWALDRGYDIIVQIDADMSHDPMDIPAMVELLKTHDLVIGSRYKKGVSVVNWPIRRLILSYGNSFSTSFSFFFTSLKSATIPILLTLSEEIDTPTFQL